VSSRRGARLLVAGVLATAGVLTGCTGVPTSSSPQTVEAVNVAPATEQAIRPGSNDSPRDIVGNFLDANAIDPGKHTSARAFMTPAARSRWSDATVTILRERVVSPYDARNGTVTVSGPLFGTLDRDGVFEPGDGTQVSYVFRLGQVGRQYRIAQISPAPGLLITADEFANGYTRHVLYFFDNENRYLVPDPRYTDIADRTPLANWLLDRLVDGPRPSLQTAVSSDTFPAQIDPSATSVDVEATTRVEIPGSSQLDGGGLRRLAAQVSRTLDEQTSGGGMVITDNGRAVLIPSLDRSSFTADDFAAYLGPPPPESQVYYLDGRELVNEGDKPVAGPLGRGIYGLTSVAVSRPSPTGSLVVAGVEGVGPAAHLLVGNQTTGLKPADVTGVTTRPSFATGRHELWVGAGTKLYRLTVTSTGAVLHGQPVAFAQPPAGQLRAIRVSPDGARLAFVFGSAPKDGRLYVGAVVRGSGAVRIAPLELISPAGAVVEDVAWLSPLRVFAVGRVAGGRPTDSYTFDTEADGTEWQAHLVGLSSVADSVTASSGALPWLSAGNYVWVQSGSEWQPPVGGQTPGAAPVYLE